MQIELLWIIPIVAFAFFIFIVIFVSQKKDENTGQDLSRDVARFNNGLTQYESRHSQPDQRIGELEKAISTVTESIASQQAVMEQFQKENSAYSSEISELKAKLRDLYKEYDIVLSENYSLRAKVKKLMEGRDNGAALPGSDSAPPKISKSAPQGKANLKLYEDTRLLNLTALDDTSEIDLSEIR